MIKTTLKEGIPRHIQITQWIRGQITEGFYQPDEKLPSENELAKRFDVSRVTVRRALQSLENDQVIYRCQGLGSFVSDGRSPHALVRLTDFHEDMVRANMNPSSLVVRFDVIPAKAQLESVLEIKPGSQVLQIDRLRMGNGSPVAYDRTWLPVFYGQLLDQETLQDRSIYNILEEEYDIQIMKGVYQLGAAVADEEMAPHVQVQVGEPLFLIKRVSYTIAGKPVYFQHRFYRNDKVIFEMTLERTKDGRPGDQMPLKEFVPRFIPEPK